MRRAQIDEGSQIHRNLAGNPAFLAASPGTQVFRTNWCQYPNMEASSGFNTVRTNLCTNPRGVFTFPGYGSDNNQTVTPNVTISGHPEGITIASRVEYSNATNPGVVIMIPATSGTLYAISCWVYHETIAATPGSAALAQAGVTSDPNAPAIVQGVWQRHTWIRTSTSTNHYGFRVSGQAGTGSFLITGITIEAAPAGGSFTSVGSFFDGATEASGDFTYAWSGAANASTSIQRAPNVQGWAAASLAVIYQSSSGPAIGTKTQAVVTKGSSGDGTFVADVTVVAGTSYTMSAWVKITDVVSNLSGSLRWKDTAQTIIGTDYSVNVQASLVVGEYRRVSITGVAPVGATRLQAMWRIYATHTPTTFYVDGVLISDHPIDFPYFDGATAAAGDFTYWWAGTANTSASYQRVKLVNALSASRNGSALDSRFSVWESTAEDGKKTAKWLSPAGTTNSTWRVATINASSVGWSPQSVKAGGQYTLFLRYRGSGWGAGQTVSIMIADGGSQNQVINYGAPAPVLNTTGWVEYRRTFTALRDATFSSTIYMSLPLVPQTTTDGVFEIRDWALYEGEYTGDLIIGSNPFSKWEGVAHQSPSIGYPQQLLDIAGKPILDYSAAGTYTLDNSFGNTEGRTFYTVVESLAELSAGLDIILQYGDNALNDTVANTYINLRFDTDSVSPNGTNGLFLRRTGGFGVNRPATSARHVSAWGIQSSGFLYQGVDGAIPTVDNTAMNLSHQKLYIASNNATHTHIRTIGYRGVHNDATRLAISRYLGNKYGAAIA